MIRALRNALREVHLTPRGWFVFLCIWFLTWGTIGTAMQSLAPSADTLQLAASAQKIVTVPQMVVVKPKPVPKYVVPKPKPVVRQPTKLPTAPAPAPRLAAGSVQARIAAAWPGDDAKVLCLVRKESGFNPHAKSAGGTYWGLFQADSGFRATYGWAGWGVGEQVRMAWRGFQARGWQPWPPAAGC